MNFSDIPMVEPIERGQIAFARMKLGGSSKVLDDWTWDIYTIAANATDLRQLTHDAKAYEFHFSPDGTQIAYRREIWSGTAPGVRLSHELCIMNVDGNNQKCFESDERIVSLMWSHNGEQLIYSTADNNLNLKAYIMDKNLQQRLLEANDIAPILSPLWRLEEDRYIEHRVISPDREKVALVRIDENGQALLDVANISDEEQLQIEHVTNEYNALIPAWSPDSENIAFVALPPELWWDYKTPEALHILNIKSGDIRKLVDVDFGGLSRYEVYPYAPVWSPDGSRIAFIGLYDPKNRTDDIYLVNPDGTNLRRVTTDGLPKANLAWQKESSE